MHKIELFSIIQAAAQLLSVTFSHCPHGHTPLFLGLLPRMIKPSVIFCYSLLQMEPSFCDPPPPPSAYVFIYSNLFLSFFHAPLLFAYLFSHISLSVFPPLPTFRTGVSSFCQQPCFHNNLRPFTHCITIFNQK